MASRSQDQGGFRGYAPQSAQQEDSISVIDQYSNFDGTYQSTRDLRIEGQVKGTIECRGTLYVQQGAVVNARVEAENISVAGELEGEVTCRGRLQLLPSGRAKGVIHTQTLVIHEGAYYEGDLTMGDGRRQRSERRSHAAPQTSRPDEASPTTSDEPSVSPAPTQAAPVQNAFIRRFGGQDTEQARPQDAATGDNS